MAVKIGSLDDTFLGVFFPQASPVEGQLLQQKKRKGEKGKGKDPKIEKPKDVGHLRIFISAHAHAKML